MLPLFAHHRGYLRRALGVALAVLALAAPALGQGAILQGGPSTPGHAPMYLGSGQQGSQTIVQDSGPAGGGGAGLGLSEGLYVARGTGTPPYAGQGTGPFGANWCDYDAPITNPTGYHYLCLSPNAQGGGLIAYGAGGVAGQLPLNLKINGTNYAFPFVLSGIVGPGSTTVNDLACWNNTQGTLLKDCTVGPLANSKIVIDPTQAPYNCIADNVTDQTACLQGAINAGAALYGSIQLYIPPANAFFCAFGGLTLTGQGTRITGSTNRNSALSTCGHDATLITMTGSNQELQHLLLNGKGGSGDTGTFGATHPIILINNCIECLVVDVVSAGGGSSFVETDTGSPDFNLQDLVGSTTYGKAVIYIRGGGWMRRLKLDQSWPVFQPAVKPAALATGLTYHVGDPVIAAYNGKNYVYQVSACAIDCKAATTTPTPKNYGISFIDGNVTFLLVGPNDYFAVQLDSDSGEVELDKFDMSGSYAWAIGMTNTLAGAAPNSLKVMQSQAGMTTQGCILLSDGFSALITNFECAAPNYTGGYGIQTLNTWQGDAIVIGSQIKGGSYSLRHEAGTNFTAIGNTLGDAGIACFGVAANLSHFMAIGNSFGSPIYGTCPIGALVAAGTSDDYRITGNNCVSIGTNCVLDGGTGTHKVVENDGAFSAKSLTATSLSTAGLTCNSAAGLLSSCGIPLANQLSGAVALNNVATFFAGPSVAQGASGTWLASGTVGLTDTAGVANFGCKLWDGTTVIASGSTWSAGANKVTPIALSGFIANPAGNIRISCIDLTTTGGSIVASDGLAGNTNSTLTVQRVN